MAEFDIFIVHTRGDPRQLRLYRFLKAWSLVGLSIVDYEDWDWEIVDDPIPDLFGRLPDDPWLSMPRYNTDQIACYLRRCHVVAILESDSEADHSFGVRLELDELSSLPPLMKAVVVGASLDSRRSNQLRTKVGRLVSEFLQIERPEDPQVAVLLAVAWLVSRLQKSGSEGMRALDDARSLTPYIDRFVWLGPHWKLEMLKQADPISRIYDWWPQVARVDSFMEAEAHGKLLATWTTLCSAARRVS